MTGIEFGLGRFGDRRREKGGPICMPRWWRGQALAFGGWQQRARGRFNSRASFATRR
jgi:hypothetical protein